jgi:hypothetical protein
MIGLSQVLLWVAALLGADEPSLEEGAARTQAAREHLARCAMSVLTGDPAAAASNIALPQRPLLTFGDPARSNDTGTVWAYGTTGRPLAVLELYRSGTTGADWVHAIALTNTTPVALSLPDGRRWTPVVPDVPRLTVTAEPPAGTPRLRLAWMKQFVAKCAAHEFWDPDNSRYELRLLPQPLMRYADEPNGLIDGACFVFAHGTNPEILLFVEAVIHGQRQEPEWRLAAAPLGSAELLLEHEGRTLWTRPRAPGVTGTAKDDYWLFLLPSEQESETSRP